MKFAQKFVTGICIFTIVGTLVLIAIGQLNLIAGIVLILFIMPGLINLTR